MTSNIRAAGSILSRPCPCGTGRSYRDCCAPCHFGDREAPDAVALMRSRYAAFAVGDVAYLWRTLHTGHADRGREKDDVLRELKASTRQHKYMGLKVLDSLETGGSAQVLFLAKVFEAGSDRSFVELSDFLHDGEGWRYLCGVGLASAKIKSPIDGLTIASFSGLVR